MRCLKTLPLVLVFLSFLVLPSLSFPEVKIFLKNGREIIADRCRDTNGRLICEKLGGTFEFDKAEIRRMENVTIERRRTVVDSPSDTTPSDLKKEEPQAGGNGKADAKTNVEVKTGGLTPEQAERMAGIEKKRAEFEAEREKLVKEREQLREEVKAAGVIHSREKSEDIQKKINSLDARINTFNDQVNKLNKEISSLSNEPRKKTP